MNHPKLHTSSASTRPVTTVLANTVIHLFKTNQGMSLEDIGWQGELDKETVRDIVTYLNKRSLFVKPVYQGGQFRGFARAGTALPTQTA